MSLLETKSLLHKYIVETDDIELLQEIASIFDVLKRKKTDWWDTISKEEKSLIEKGIQEMKEGKGISHIEFRNEIDELLRRKRA